MWLTKHCSTTIIQENMKKCSVCNTENNDTAKFCRGCGRSLAATPPPPPPPVKEDNSAFGNLLHIIAIIVGIGGIILTITTAGIALPPFAVAVYYLTQWGNKLGGTILD